MQLLLLSILCNAGLYVIFKLFQRFKVRAFEAIVINYFTALGFGLLMVPDLKQALQDAKEFDTWSAGGLGMGLFFISIFYLTAITAQRVGVSVATIASKMSLALAVVLFAIVDPSEPLTIMKSAAIVFAVGGVIFSTISDDIKKFQLKQLGLPLMVLLGSTLVDFSIAHFSKFPHNENQMALFSCLPFFTSGVIGLVAIIYKFLKNRDFPTWRDFAGGVVLGCVNYGSIYFLVKVYDSGIWPRSILLPINNLSVVIVAAAIAFLFFKEKFSLINILGILLSVTALVILMNI
ncbi:MAG: hypothetical protein R2809_11780 [Flavobacteriales bacterium]